MKDLVLSLVSLFYFFGGLADDFYKCECDYFIPANVIDIRVCGHTATCYWALGFYLAKMGYPQQPNHGFPSIKDINDTWQNVMRAYEGPFDYPLINEDSCGAQFNTCLSHMQTLFTLECKRLEGDIKLDPPILLAPVKQLTMGEMFLETIHLWKGNWTLYYLKGLPRKNSYIVNCPTGFYFDTYHFTLSQLLSTANIEYYSTMMIEELVHLIPQKHKEFYTCYAANWTFQQLRRNSSHAYHPYCLQLHNKPKYFLGLICDLEDDPTIKTLTQQGPSVLCKGWKLFQPLAVDDEAIVDRRMKPIYEKDCNERKDCPFHDHDTFESFY